MPLSPNDPHSAVSSVAGRTGNAPRRGPAAERALARRLRQLERAGGAIDDLAAAERLDCRPRTLDSLLGKRRLFAVDLGRGERRWPSCQWHEGRLLAGLPETLDALRFDDGWLVLSFLVHRSKRLGCRTPLDLLRSEQLDPVLWFAGVAAPDRRLRSRPLPPGTRPS